MKTDHFEQLYRGNYARLYYYAFRFVADEEACRDIVNDVFEQAWKDREQLQEATAVACLYTRTRNRCIDYLRHRQVEQQYATFLRTLTSEDPSVPPGEREERVRRMERCLERMTDPTRSIVKQCYYDGKKYREVAEERGITPDGVKKHIVKALRMLPLTGRREYTVFRAGPAGGEVKGELLLRPGEGTDCSLDRKTVEDAEDCRAWTGGRFAFDDAPLVEIMRELGRWYNVDIVFTDREVMQERLHFRADRRDSLEQVLELLNCLRKVRARIEDGRVVVGV